MFAEQVRIAPAKPAVLDDGRVLTYRELADQAQRIAGWLTAQGVAPDALVAILVERSADLPACALGVWFAGAAVLAVDPSLPRARLRTILGQARPAAVLAQRAFLGKAGNVSGPVLVVDQAASDDQASTSGTALAPVNEEHLAYVIYTSGSSGPPKLVGVSHRALRAVFHGWNRSYGLLGDPPQVIQAASFGFDVAIGDLVRTLASGGCLVTCRREALLDPHALHTLMRTAGVDYAEFTPSLLRPLVDHLLRDGGRLDFLRFLIIGGERWTTAEYRRLREVVGPEVRIFNSYGLTEAAIDSTLYEVGATLPTGTTVPIGRPIGDTRLFVLDANLRNATLGELYIGGDQLARGYLDDPAATAERFVAAPGGPAGTRMYRTGDIVQRLPSGDLVFMGRADDQVKVRGVRLNPVEVQDLLETHPAIRGAVVVPTERAGKTELAAYLLTVGARRPDIAAIRRYAMARMHPAMVPAYIRFVDALPVTLNGKADLALLPPPGPADPDVEIPQPQGIRHLRVQDPQTVLTHIWSQLLGRTITEVDQDFFELGGDSVLAAQMVAQVRADLGVDLPPGAPFRHPTISELARLVASSAPAEPIKADPARSEGPLSPTQQQLWLLDRLTSGLSSYNVAALIRIDGPLDLPALKLALHRLVARHESLRTVYVMSDAGPVQRIESWPAEPDSDLLESSPASDLAGTHRWLAEVARRPFDLGRPPLIRAGLTGLVDGGRQLLLAMHHIASDGWTVRILLRELGEIYSALVTGQEPRLRHLPMRYLDFASWQARRLERGDFDRQLEYWRAQLLPLPPALQLPSVAHGEGDTTRRTQRVGAEIAEALQALAAEFRTTTFVTLLAPLVILLHRWSGDDDLVVGVPFGERVVPGTEDLVGFFVNTIAVRSRLQPDACFADVLSFVRSAIGGAFGNQDIPFDVVRHRLGMSGGSRAFAVWFNMLGEPDPPPVMSGLRTAVLDPPVTGPVFDLNVYVVNEAQDLRIDLVFDSARYDDVHMAEFLNQYILLLRQVAAEPEAKVGGLSLVTSPSDGAPTTPGPHAAWPSLPAVLAERVKHAATRRAVSSDDGDVSYTALSAWAGDIVRRLRECHVHPSDVVAVYAHRGRSLAAILLAIIETGAAFCILDPAYPAARLATQMTEAEPVAMVHATAAGPLPPELSYPPVIVIDEDPAAGPALTGRLSGELMYVAFTSGTTGTPVMVPGTAEPVVHFLEWYTRQFGLDQHDVFAMLSGLSHDPLLRDVLTPLWVGATLCVPPAYLLRSPRELLEWLRAEQVTVLHVTPPLIRLMTSAGFTDQLATVRLVVSAGDQLYYGDVQRLRRLMPRAVIVNGYGMTETPQLMTCEVVPDTAASAHRVVPIGRAIDGVDVSVENSAGQPAGTGELGQIVVRTRYLARGLGPSFLTGDKGRLLPDGTIELAGRADDRGKVSGFRLEPAEIDHFARRVPGIRDCATVAQPGPEGDLRLVTFAVSEPHQEVTISQLRAALSVHLPAYALPAFLVPVDGLPLTPNGKVDRSALASMPLSGQAAPAGTAILTGTEITVAAVWKQVLGTDLLAPESNFFDIGGSSLAAVRASRMLEQALGHPVSVIKLFEHPILRALAAHLTDDVDVSPLSTQTTKPVSPDAHRRLAIRMKIREESAHDG